MDIWELPRIRRLLRQVRAKLTALSLSSQTARCSATSLSVASNIFHLEGYQLQQPSSSRKNPVNDLNSNATNPSSSTALLNSRIKIKYRSSRSFKGIKGRANRAFNPPPDPILYDGSSVKPSSSSLSLSQTITSPLRRQIYSLQDQFGEIAEIICLNCLRSSTSPNHDLGFSLSKPQYFPSLSELAAYQVGKNLGKFQLANQNSKFSLDGVCSSNKEEEIYEMIPLLARK